MLNGCGVWWYGRLHYWPKFFTSFCIYVLGHVPLQSPPPRPMKGAEDNSTPLNLSLSMFLIMTHRTLQN